MPTYKFADIIERDMDLLFLEELVSSEAFLKIFLSRIGLKNANIISAEHSKKDNDLGESDLTIILENHFEKIALLIEDKIDAIAQPKQSSRYIERGNKGISDGEYDKYYIFIVAPSTYLETNEEAKKYPNSVSYEEVLAYFENKNDKRSLFKAIQIKKAIYKKESGYQPIVHNGVSDFWEKYVAYQKENYPDLLLASSAGKKGSAASWPRFRTQIKGLYMLHKSEFGYIDLTFESAKVYIQKIDNLIKSTFGSYDDIGASIVVTGKSVALRMLVPKLDFKLSFEEQKTKVEECFNTINKMTRVANQLDAVSVMNILKGDYYEHQ